MSGGHSEPRTRAALALIEAAVAGRELPDLLQAFSEALSAGGLRLARAAVGTLLLHPVLDATLVIWRRGQGASTVDTPRPTTRGDEAWRRSPFYRLVQTGERQMRLCLERGQGADEFAMLAELAAEGGTDYLALRTELGPTLRLGEASDVFSSWVSDRPGGFTAEEIALLHDLQPLVGFVVASTVTGATARTLLATYLGADAAARVLAGAIERGHAETIHAAIWYSDLEGFTRLSDTLPRQELLTLLNAYAEALVEAIEGQGGQVLKFVGDGILATFQAAVPADACAAALAAWEEARRAAEAVSAERTARGLAVTRPYLALHVGEVLYGNIGGKARLDFTVLGPAVNEAARIAALCRSLDQPVILSQAFAAACAAGQRRRLVQLGRFALRGVSQPQMLHTVEPDTAPPA